MNRTPIRGTAVLAAILLALGLGACAGGTNTASESSGGGSSAGFPVTVPGKLGPATVTKQPRRVVAMDWTDADIALALGVTPVGMASVSTAEGGIEPWTKQLLGNAKPTLFNADTGDPIEKVAALKPDLILATKDYNLVQSHPQLSALAPVVSYVNGPNNDNWQTATRSIAKALGRSAKAEQAIAKVTNDIKATKQTHPELVGKTYNFLVTPQSDGTHAVNSTQDVSASFLSQLGLVLAPAVQSMQTSSIPGRTMVSWENISQLNADLLLATGPPHSLKFVTTVPTFQAMQVVKQRHYAALQPALAQAVAFPSSVSLEWALHQLIPLLDKAIHP